MLIPAECRVRARTWHRRVIHAGLGTGPRGRKVELDLEASPTLSCFIADEISEAHHPQHLGHPAPWLSKSEPCPGAGRDVCADGYGSQRGRVDECDFVQIEDDSLAL